jgi:homoserine kinase type II
VPVKFIPSFIANIMAVYTKITQQQLANHLAQYQLGELLSMHEIIDGIDNSNFIINTTTGKYIFTIFESRIKSQDLPFFINLKQHLANKNISCPLPINNKQGNNISDFANKSTAIVSFLDGQTLKPHSDGYYYNITAQHCFEVGKQLAKMHLATADFLAYRHNDLGCLELSKFAHKFSHQLDPLIPTVLSFLEQSWQQNCQNTGPLIPCHLDLFPDNVFFDDRQNLTGVIDFYFAANDLPIYDFAIVVNAWCFDKTTFNQHKFEQLLMGYQAYRIFTQAEMLLLPIANIAAATRFYLTRLSDKIFTKPDSLVKIKDPSEYLAKLQYFCQNL